MRRMRTGVRTRATVLPSGYRPQPAFVRSATLGVLLVAAVACSGTQAAGLPAARAPAGEAAGRGLLWIAWAGVIGPNSADEIPELGPALSGSVVELRLIVANRLERATESTSVIWDPEFARQFEFVGSQPRAWRVRLDELGRGVLDTAGIIPGTEGTFRLWFRSVIGATVEPDLVVVADGQVEVGRLRVTWGTPAEQRSQHRLTRIADSKLFGVLASAAAWIPAEGKAAFIATMTAAVLVGLLGLAAGAVALWAAVRAPPWLEVEPTPDDQE